MHNWTPLVVLAAALFAAACNYPQLQESQCTSQSNNTDAGGIDNPALISLSTANTTNLSKRSTGGKSHIQADEKQQTLSRAGLQRIKLTLVERFLWAGDIWIGNPEQGPFRVVFDTGHPYLWVTSSDSKYRYRPEDNYPSPKTYQAKAPGKPSRYKTVEGWEVSGTMYRNRVRFGQFARAGVPFVAAMKRPPGPVDGNYGLAPTRFESLADDNSPRAFRPVVEMHVPGPNVVFAFYLAKANPMFYICGFDMELAASGVEYHPMITEFRGWAIGNGKVFKKGVPILKDGKNIGNNVVTLFRSGMQTVEGPAEVVETIYKEIDGKLEGGLYHFPCSKAMEVSFSWDGMRQWKISSDDFILGRDKDGIMCTGSIKVSTSPGAAKYADPNVKQLWILGGAFMKDKYTIIDGRRGLIGLTEAER